MAKPKLNAKQKELNDSRVRRAKEFLATYHGRTCDALDQAMTDALTDMMHFAKKHNRSADFELSLAQARLHFMAESTGREDV